MKILALVTDAFGGCGGIARYNRDFLTAACTCDRVERVVCLPRLARETSETIPRNLIFDRRAAGGPGAYLGAAVRTAGDRRGWDLIFCGHINLVPIAAGGQLSVGGRRTFLRSFGRSRHSMTSSVVGCA